MDGFVQDLLFQEHVQDMFWYEEIPAPTKSAFIPYPNRTGRESGFPEKFRDGWKRSGNINSKMMGILKRVHDQKMREREPVRNRCVRHMLNERTRRERQKQSYTDLHSLLPFGTKNDKNSIIQSAAKRIEDLQRRKEELLRRICAMEKNLIEPEGSKIRVTIPNPVSGSDSMIAVLKYLKNSGTKTSLIHAKLSSSELSAVINIQSESVAAGEVERPLEITGE